MSPLKRSKSKFLSPETLERTARMALELLRDHGIAAAVVGGYAMQMYGSPRLTGDVDMISSDTPVQPSGLRATKPLTFGGRRYVTNEGVELDLIVRSDQFQALYQEALTNALITEDGLPVVSPEYMAPIKLAAGRPKDEDDLIWIFQQENLVDRAKALDIADRLLGGQYAKASLQSFIDEADWRSDRERRAP
jgi:hypothetical protein